LAVAPFQFVGPKGNQKLSEEVTRVLSKSLAQLDQFQGSLSVLSPVEALEEQVTGPKEPVVGLGANLVLTGSVFQDPDRLTVAANLRDAQKQIVVNATETQGSIDQLPRLHESLLKKVAEILHTKIHEADGTGELCQQGRGYLQRYDRIQNLENAISLFDRALAKDPKYAPAHAGRAEARRGN